MKEKLHSKVKKYPNNQNNKNRDFWSEKNNVQNYKYIAGMIQGPEEHPGPVTPPGAIVNRQKPPPSYHGKNV